MSERYCLACGEKLLQKASEQNYNFSKRKTCDRTCAGDYSKFTGRNAKKKGFVGSYLARLEREHGTAS